MLYAFVALVGASMGSFIGALTWRLHVGKDFVNDRSICEHCEHVLAWYDLLPVFSWLQLGGHCRYCKASIGWSAIALEISLMALGVLSLWAWPHSAVVESDIQKILFGVWLAIVVLLAALFVYDIRWMLLPNKLVLPLGVLVVVYRAIEVINGAGVAETTASMLLGTLIGGGLFYVLFQVSGGRWIGGGDVKLGFVMGSLLGPAAALTGLVVAFYASAVFVVPLMLAKKLSRKSKVPFGPFLIVGFLVAFLWGQELQDIYFSFAGVN